MAAGMLSVRCLESRDSKDKRKDMARNKMPIVNVLLLENSSAMLSIIDICFVYSVK